MKIMHSRPGRRVLAADAAALIFVLAAIAYSASSFGSSPRTEIINGAGSTFAAPMYQQWTGQYGAAHHVQVNYQGIGSADGIAEFSERVTDFGATDAPMTGAEQAAAQDGQGGVVLYIPMIIGAVAICYNEPGVTGLRLDGPTLAGIYLGNISRWDDPAIKALNPGVFLPHDAIEPVDRADSSGTSFALTSYLSAISPVWASQIGVSKSPGFPVGITGIGSSGMVAVIGQVRGAIGYVEYGYAVRAHLPIAFMKNASGQFVAPSTMSITAATAAVTYPTALTRLTFSLINSLASAAYPIVSPTYVLIARRQQDKATGTALKSWLEWDLAPAQQNEVSGFGYAPLPPELVALDRAALATVH